MMISPRNMIYYTAYQNGRNRRSTYSQVAMRVVVVDYAGYAKGQIGLRRLVPNHNETLHDQGTREGSLQE